MHDETGTRIVDRLIGALRKMCNMMSPVQNGLVSLTAEIARSLRFLVASFSEDGLLFITRPDLCERLPHEMRLHLAQVINLIGGHVEQVDLLCKRFVPRALRFSRPAWLEE